MDFSGCMRLLRRKLRAENPRAFTGSWVAKHAPAVYRFIRKNVRTEIGQIDWDRVTIALPRRYQKRWTHYRRKYRNEYEDPHEVEKIMDKHRNTLYLFIAVSDEKERQVRHRMTVAFVRLAQKGNVLAMRELVDFLRYTVDEWIDRYFLLYRWRGAESEINGAIEGCIRRYRYTGTFFGYLFKTLEYSAHALKPFYSIDDYLPGTDMRRSEIIGQDAETGEIKTYGFGS